MEAHFSLQQYVSDINSPLSIGMQNHKICLKDLSLILKIKYHITRVSQKLLRVDSYLLCRLTYTGEIWHKHALNCSASEYAIYKTMQSINWCCLANEECEITSCVHAEI